MSVVHHFQIGCTEVLCEKPEGEAFRVVRMKDGVRQDGPNEHMDEESALAEFKRMCEEGMSFALDISLVDVGMWGKDGQEWFAMFRESFSEVYRLVGNNADEKYPGQTPCIAAFIKKVEQVM